jgi:hypothetical protein
MKYLKLYENFNNSIEDTLEDIKWILLEMADSHEPIGREKDYCMLYAISNKPSEEDLDVAKNRLDDLGYSIVYIDKPKTLFQNHAYNLKDKTLCWIVKSEFCKEWSPLPIIVNGKFEGNKVIEDIQKRILLKMWKEDPSIDCERLEILCIFNNNQIQNKVETLFREYLGPKSKQIINSILRNKKHHISYGGYEFDIIIESYEIDEGHYTVDIKCKVLPGGTVSIIMDDGRTLNIEDAVNDEVIGWEIKGEISDCIEDYIYKDLQIRNKTGFRIEVEFYL